MVARPPSEDTEEAREMITAVWHLREVTRYIDREEENHFEELIFGETSGDSYLHTYAEAYNQHRREKEEETERKEKNGYMAMITAIQGEVSTMEADMHAKIEGFKREAEGARARLRTVEALYEQILAEVKERERLREQPDQLQAENEEPEDKTEVEKETDEELRYPPPTSKNLRERSKGSHPVQHPIKGNSTRQLRVYPGGKN